MNTYNSLMFTAEDYKRLTVWWKCGLFVLKLEKACQCDVSFVLVKSRHFSMSYCFSIPAKTISNGRNAALASEHPGVSRTVLQK